MKYLTTTQIAEKWGVSRRTVHRYVTEGRIKNAQLINKIWMIPEDTKKEDCLKQDESVLDTVKNEFHFPLYIYRDFYQLKDKLKTYDELKLYEGFELFINCEFKNAYDIFIDLNNSSDDIYIKIATLYMLAMCSLNLHKYSKMMSYILEMNEIFVNDFEYKEEMNLMLMLLESEYKGLASINSSFIKPGYKYSKEAVPTATLLNLYSEAINSLDNNKDINTNIYELALSEFEESNYIFPSIMIHIELGAIYYNLDKLDIAHYHFINAYELSIKNNGLYYFAYISESISTLVMTCLKNSGIIIDTNLNTYYKQVKKTYLGLMSYLNKPSTIYNLTSDDYGYVVFAIKKMTNKEIALHKGISESAVAQRYAKLYGIFNVNNKDQLVEEFKKKHDKY